MSIVRIFSGEWYRQRQKTTIAAIATSGDEYIASSTRSNSYEFGVTPGRAIKNYLELLVDELTRLEKHKAELSPQSAKTFASYKVMCGLCSANSKDSLYLHLFSFEEALKGLLETEPPPIS